MASCEVSVIARRDVVLCGQVMYGHKSNVRSADNTRPVHQSFKSLGLRGGRVAISSLLTAPQHHTCSLPFISTSLAL